MNVRPQKVCLDLEAAQSEKRSIVISNEVQEEVPGHSIPRRSVYVLNEVMHAQR